jgi:hypothetical protein
MSPLATTVPVEATKRATRAIIVAVLRIRIMVCPFRLDESTARPTAEPAIPYAPRGRRTIDAAGRVAAGGFGRPRKVRTPQGRTLGKSQAAKADGKWNREETAGAHASVRVKRWGKSPPAPW